jgi:hypothetical protein
MGGHGEPRSELGEALFINCSMQLPLLQQYHHGQRVARGPMAGRCRSLAASV